MSLTLVNRALIQLLLGDDVGHQQPLLVVSPAIHV